MSRSGGAGRILFVLYYPILHDGRHLYFRDITNVKTLETCRGLGYDCEVVARIRRVASNQLWTKVQEAHAELPMLLPDYGCGGAVGWLNLLRFVAPPTWFRLWRIARAAELVYVEVPSVEAYIVSWVASWARRPVVMEMRAEMVLNTGYMKARFGWKGRYYVMVLDWLFRRVRRYATGAIYINSSCMRRYPIANGLMAAICDAELPAELFQGAKDRGIYANRFLYVGNLEKVKSIDMILLALAHARPALDPTWRLHIVGDGPEGASLQAMAANLKLAGNIVWHGRVNWGNSLFRFYEECDVLIVASMSETGPRVLLEAMAAGMPAISTRVGMAEELLPASALVEVGDAEMLAEKIVEIASNPERVRRMSNENGQRIREMIETNWAEKRVDFWREMTKVQHA